MVVYPHSDSVSASRSGGRDDLVLAVKIGEADTKFECLECHLELGIDELRNHQIETKHEGKRKLGGDEKCQK